MQPDQAYNYHLKASDLLEAEQLKLDSFQPKWVSSIAKPLTIIYISALPITSLIRIKHHDFMVVSWIPSVSEAIATKTTTDYIGEAFFMLLIFFLVVDTSYPKLGIVARWKSYRDYQKNYIKQEPKQLIISDHNIKIISENLTETIEWTGLEKFVENKQIFLLSCDGNREYKIIPKRAFTQSTDLETFQGILIDKINNQPQVN